MTGQVYDQCEHEGVTYMILGDVGEGLPTPALFNIVPVDLLNWFHRGYIMYYAIVDNQLLLDKMVVTTRTVPQEINGIVPEVDEDEYTYTGLNYPVRFTGFFNLGKDLIWELRTPMGFQPAWTYNTVLKITFESGIVTDIFDRSAEIARQREQEIELKKSKDTAKRTAKKPAKKAAKKAVKRAAKKK